MDETTSRTGTPGRRMASAKPATSTRKTTTGTSSKKSLEPEISPARWAGVGLVIAALLGAILLAVISPSDPESDLVPAVIQVDASPTPVASASADTRLPTVTPKITVPVSGSVTDEWDLVVSLDVAADDLPRKDLTLVILRGDDVIGERPRPKLGGQVTVAGVRMVKGLNNLTAALQGPGGLGPVSEPVAVTLDVDAPKLALISPTNRFKTFEDTVKVAGTSEPGAEVRVINEVLGFDSGQFVVGPDGAFDITVPLKKGRNEIVAESKDEAGQDRDATVVVTRKDGRPFIEIEAPKKLERGTLPRDVKLGVVVTDSDGDKMPNAEVTYSLGGTGRPAETYEAETNANGRSSWSVPITSGNANTIQLVVEVTSPHGQTKSARHEIEIR